VLASSGSIAVWDATTSVLTGSETLAEATRPQFTTGAYGFGFQIGRPDEARSYGTTKSANAIVTVLLMPLLRASGLYKA